MASVQVFARDVRADPEAPLTFLERGQADAYRADARAGLLVCPLADCSDPRLVVRAGSKRDHFAHRPGAGGHGPETIAHHTAKHLIGHWLRGHYPDVQVDVDTKHIDTGRLPDVLVTLSTGRQVGYEVQFAALTAAEWGRRHQAYVDAGVRDVWLFGGRRYDRPPRGWAPDDTVAVVPLLEGVLAAWHPMLLIDPFEEAVGLGTGPAVEERLLARGRYPDRVQPVPHAALTRWPLSQARVAAGVIDLPGLRDLMARTGDDQHVIWCEQRAAEQADLLRQTALAEARIKAAQDQQARRKAEREAQAERKAAEALELAAKLEAQRARQAQLADVVHQGAHEPDWGVSAGVARPRQDERPWSMVTATHPRLWDDIADRTKTQRPETVEGFIRRQPELAAWVAAHPDVDLAVVPERLRRHALAVAYAATELSVAGPVSDLPIDGLSVQDVETVLSALQGAGLIVIEQRGEYRRWRASRYTRILMSEAADSALP